jgi:Putative transposase
VLSLPHRLRYLLAWDHDLCRAVLGFLRRRADRDGVDDGRSGAVVVVQHFGGALNPNIHLHALVLDGVFTNDGAVVRFHPVRRLTRDDVAEVVALVARRGLAGRAEDGEASDPRSDEAPVLAAVAAASVEGRVALGPRAGARVRRCGDPPEEGTPVTLGRCHAHAGGFDLHAGLVVRASQRDRLERVCRYALRPPLAQERLHQTREGEIWLTLRHRWADGTTHLRFDPLELLERLAVLTPRPRVNLIFYYGVLAPRAAWRAALVRGASHGVDLSGVESSVEADEDAGRVKPFRPGAYQWAELMRRTFGLDVLACPRCGRHGPRPGDSRHWRINPKTLLNSMPPGEGVASREEGCRRGALFLFPHGCSLWYSCQTWR